MKMDKEAIARFGISLFKVQIKKDTKSALRDFVSFSGY
jgi:hypothetical protein